MKKGLMIGLTAFALATSLFTAPQQSNAAESCELTIDANKHHTQNWSYAGGVCDGFIQGIYVPETKQFTVMGIYSGNVKYSGQQFEFRIPTYDDSVILTVNTIKPGETAPVNTNNHEFVRKGGSDRYGTNLALSKDIKAQSLDHVFIASGTNYPDALAAGALSGSLNGTVLIINDRQSTQDLVIAEIQRILKPSGKVLILGGTGAVSVETEVKLKSTNYAVERLSGQTRTLTALAIAEKVNSYPAHVFLVNGQSYPDALSVVPAAAKTKQPILLNRTADKLDPAVMEYLETKQVQKVTIIGGTGVIGTGIAETLAAKGITIDRLSGKTRYDTSLAVAKKYFPSSSQAGLAYSRNFPDALSGGSYAFRNNMPILLTDNEKPTDSIRSWINQSDKTLHFFGGTGALPESLKDKF